MTQRNLFMKLPGKDRSLVEAPRIDRVLTLCRAGGRRFMLSHPLEPGSPPRLGSGTPVSASEVESLLRDLSPDAGGWIDERILIAGGARIAFWIPATTRLMWFAVGNSKPMAFMVPWPALVAVLHRSGGLQVYALDTTSRPTPQSPLFHAPLMNFNEEGEMCFGNLARIPFSVSQYATVVSTICDSKFTHVNHARTLRARSAVSTPKNLQFWKKLHMAKAFPLTALNPAAMTAEDLLK